MISTVLSMHGAEGVTLVVTILREGQGEGDKEKGEGARERKRERERNQAYNIARERLIFFFRGQACAGQRERQGVRKGNFKNSTCHFIDVFAHIREKTEGGKSNNFPGISAHPAIERVWPSCMREKPTLQ